MVRKKDVERAMKVHQFFWYPMDLRKKSAVGSSTEKPRAPKHRQERSTTTQPHIIDCAPTMKFTGFCLLALVLLAAMLATSVNAGAPKLRYARPDRVIEGHYIVVFQRGATADARATHMERLAAFLVHLDAEHNRVKDTFLIGAHSGFGALLDQHALEHQLAEPLVAYIEQDQLMFASVDSAPVPELAHTLDGGVCSRQKTTEWNLQRINERELDLETGRYVYPGSAGSDVNAYIVDTGILVGSAFGLSCAQWWRWCVCVFVCFFVFLLLTRVPFSLLLLLLLHFFFFSLFLVADSRRV
jgi:Peptidase inhibitor I9